MVFYHYFFCDEIAFLMNLGYIHTGILYVEGNGNIVSHKQ